jgi:hypothetical protein
MAQIKISCDECDTQFYVVFDPDECDTEPTFCPFCAASIMECDYTEDEEEQ